MHTEQDEKEYPSFLINRALSMHVDSVLFAEQIAKFRDIPSKWAYDYYFYSIRSMKRGYSKWPKKEENEITEALMQYYQVNRRNAENYQKILTEKQINSILQDMEKGGI